MDKILWEPKNIEQTNFNRFIELVNSRFNINLETYEDIYRWSVNNILHFWDTTLEYSDIIYSEKYSTVLENKTMVPGGKWFPGLKLNFAENLLKFQDDKTAIISKIENCPARKITYKDLLVEVEKLSTVLRDLGIERGDRVVGFLKHTSYTVCHTFLS